jgi:hypothetical protein
MAATFTLLLPHSITVTCYFQPFSTNKNTCQFYGCMAKEARVSLRQQISEMTKTILTNQSFNALLKIWN